MIYTSNFNTVGLFDKTRILEFVDFYSIASRSPGWWSGKEFLPLAPTPELIGGYKKGIITEGEYRKKYFRILSYLTFETVFDILKPGAVLLCYENAGQFCHRFLASEWLEKNGVQVRELNQERMTILFSYKTYLSYPQGNEKKKVLLFINQMLEKQEMTSQNLLGRSLL